MLQLGGCEPRQGQHRWRGENLKAIHNVTKFGTRNSITLKGKGRNDTETFGLENCVMPLSNTGNIEEKASFDGDNQVTFGLT